MRAIFAILLTVLMPLDAVQQEGPPPGSAPPPRVTDRARPDFGSRPWAGSAATVIVVFSVECSECVASIPFYRRVKDRIGPNSDRQSVVFLTQDGVWPAIDLLKSEGFDPGRVLSYPRDDRFALKGMPAVFLYGADWKRVGEWNGRLDAAQERQVLTAIEGLIGRAKGKGDDD